VYVFPAALQNTDLLEAATAMCLSFRAAGCGFKGRLPHSALYHKGLALSAIRDKLANGIIDEAVMAATVFLMITDVSNRHF
jgi:hypothetical protein